jgi:hypothetical protein
VSLTLFDDPSTYVDTAGVTWTVGDLDAANRLLRRRHYLGPITAGGARVVVVGERDGEPVACQVWRYPTARLLPNDRTWLELSRWCLTPAAGPNAGSRCHRYAVPWLRSIGARTLLSYSDPSAGHTGSLYRACNWLWAPHWQRLRPPPSGGGEWRRGERQHVKDRWVFHVTKRDPHRDAVLTQRDMGAVRHWQQHASPEQRRWAAVSPYMRSWVPA